MGAVDSASPVHMDAVNMETHKSTNAQIQTLIDIPAPIECHLVRNHETKAFVFCLYSYLSCPPLLPHYHPALADVPGRARYIY